ncbi:acyl-CoA dehydrogenase family protein [Cupriavidus sp. IK-TO18]|uniref:acyl-CoA dehydrogenase family protein n=1 Tax=Cupriavidus sp. IK-TO18 TaxID=2782182 RepID=UPI00189AD610|nr:acyl-CoA dehydrogenase family protein [Cupriavidus sp. IK-TO18]MBF6990812.1 acyl-CoA/acyl-ACP dehydrogenase [Cupriavidus sp. IK-TO18]
MSLPNDYQLTEAQRLIRDSVLELLASVLPREKIQALDEASEFPLEAYEALARAGWMGLLYDTRFGGAGGSFKDLAIFVEAVAYHNAQMASAYLATVVYGGMQISHGASDAVKEEILPAIISGKTRMALCLTEPEAGSDVSAIRTSAIADGDDYIINGQKVFITCAHVAHQLVVATKTDRDAGRHGISLFVVDARSAGLTIRPLKALGRRMIHTNEVFFDNVRVSASRMLGARNGGWNSLMRGLNLERLCLSAAASGNIQKIIDYAKDYASERRQFGRPITDYQAISQKFADLQIMAETTRVLTYRVADMLDAGLQPTAETAIAKVVATENNCKCADMGIQIMGGAGYMMEHEMQMYFRDARVGPIGGGTSEIMRTIIAKQMGL